MGYKTFVSMNIAIVGNGRYCEALARGLAAAGHQIFIGTKSEYDYVSEGLLKRYRNICPASVEYAGAIADVIIMATPPDDVREMAYFLEDVRKKVIIDLTSLNLNRYGNYTNTSNAIKAITGSADVVKCYNTTGYENLMNEGKAIGKSDMIIAGDSKKAKAVTKLLARDLGFDECYDFGNNNLIPALDEMSNSWHAQSVAQRMNNSIAYRLVRR